MAKIYLDHAAATPVDETVLASMQPFFTDNFYNPSATYQAAKSVNSELNKARALVAHNLGAKPSEIIFTAGGTEANNLAIHGVMQQYPDSKILVSSIEHESVLEPAKKHNFQEIAVGTDGRLNIEDLAKKIDDKTVLVSVMYANNEIGTIQPLREVAKLVQEVRSKRGPKGLPLYLHTDACQAANYLDLHVARLSVDMMTINGGKIYGPKQSGALYVKAGIELVPLIEGGGQERGLRSGTENVASCVGLATALDLAQNVKNEESRRLQHLQKQFIEAVGNVEGVSVNGSLKHRLPNNVHLTFEDKDNERLLFQLDEAGIMAAAGSACSASSEEPSHVLAAIGLDLTDIQASLRFTMGRATTEAQIKTVSKVLAELLQ